MANDLSQSGSNEQNETPNEKKKQTEDLRAQRIDAEMQKLGEMLSASAKQLWRIGDQLVVLIDELDQQVTKIADQFEYKASYLSQLYNTAKAFPTDQRRKDQPWFTHEVIRSSFKKAVQSTQKATGAKLDVDYPAAMDQIINASKDNPLAERGLHDKHGATKFFIEQARKAFMPPPSDGLLAKLKSPDLIKQCHRADCRVLIERFEDGSIKILHLDPPYSNYRKYENGMYDLSRSRVRSDCDNNAREDALQVTCEVLRLSARKIRDDGVIYLWQSAANYLHGSIAQAIEESGLECIAAVTWDKGHSQPGNLGSAWSPSSEMLYVICKKGQTPENHSDGSRATVLDFAPIRQSAASFEEHHVFEKPEDMMEFLILKSSHEGELCVDLFGCSGSFCIAADRLNRNWVYCEANQANFDWGSVRILKAAEAQERKAV